MRARVWLVAAMLLWPAIAAAADIEWNLSKKDGRPYLSGMPKQPEVDNERPDACGPGKVCGGLAVASHREDDRASGMVEQQDGKRTTLSRHRGIFSGVSPKDTSIRGDWNCLRPLLVSCQMIVRRLGWVP